jgi:hypothetical protein
MASFLDETPRFREYVSQQPVEAMVQVGMQKQAMYNEGVQKIQSQIDNIAGMDVVRDVDKQYLQSKLNSLGSKLRTVAAGDFSNFQLVNSVGGMVNQIAKDKTIQNAVGSTQHYRKQLEKLQKDVDEGKSDPANEYYFQKQAQSWLNSPNVGESFNGQYVPHFDVFKFAKEQFDAVKPDGYSFDQIYVTDASGKPKIDSKGQPILSPMMVRLDKEGVFPEKVKQAIDQIFSDPRVDRQLSISGEYNFRSISAEGLSSRILNQKQKLTGMLNERLNLLQLDKNTGKDVQSEIDNVKLQIENIKTQYNQYADLALQNPDAIRATLYKDQVRSNYSTMFGWSKTKESIHSNPGWDAMFRMNQEANRVTQWEAEMQFKRDNEAFDRNIKLANLKLKEQELIDKYGSPFIAEQDFQSTDPVNYVQQFDKTIEVASERYKTTSDDLVYSMMLNSPENQDLYNKLIKAGNTKDQAIDVILREEARKDFTSFGVEPTDEQIDKRLPEMKSNLLEMSVSKLEEIEPSKLTTQQRLLKDKYTRAKQEYDNVMIMKEDYDSRVSPELKAVLDSDTFKSLTGSTKIKVGDTPVDISSQDMYDAAIYLKGRESALGFLNPSELREQSKAAENRLRERGKDFLLDYVTAYREQFLPVAESGKVSVTGVGPITGAITLLTQMGVAPMSELKDFNNKFRKVYKAIDNEEIKQATKAKIDILKDVGFTVSPNLKMGLLTGNAEADRNTKQELMRLISNYQTNNQNLDPQFKNRADDMLALLKKNEPLAIEMKTSKDDISGSVVPRVVIYDNDGKIKGALTLTSEEAANLSKKDPSSLYAPREVTLIENRIRFNPNTRTSIGDPHDVSTYNNGYTDYAFSNRDFPNLQGVSNIQVKANIAKIEDRYIPYIYVYDGQVEKVKDLGDYGSLSEVMDKLKATNSLLVNSILKEK